MATHGDHEHSADAIRRRLDEELRPSYLQDWVLGALDGIVTTFAAVAGVIGAGLSPPIVLIMGAANIVADGFSMAAGNYSATKSELERIARLRAVEERHIASFPEGERQEIREIFRRKGFAEADLDRAVEVITADPATWLDTMMVEEYGISPLRRSPLRAAAVTYLSFALCGLIPLIPFVAAAFGLGRGAAFELALAAAGLTFFFVGSLRSRLTLRSWWRSGAETLMIGLGAAGLAYAIGRALKLVLDGVG